jgi:hypothetical protein
LESKPSGRIEACRGQHDDLVMGYGFALWVRKFNIKKNKLQVDGNQLVYGLTPAAMKEYLSISLSSRDDIFISEGKTIYEHDASYMTKDEIRSRKNKNDAVSFNLDNYIIM